MYVKLWMKNSFNTLHATNTVDDAIKLFFEKDVEIVLIIRKNGTLLSSIRREDIAVLMEYNSEDPLIDVLDPIEDFLYEDDLVEDVLLTMLETNYKVLPVVDYDMKPVGLFGFHELIKAMVNITALNETGTKVILTLTDKPGELKKIVETISNNSLNILSMTTCKINKNRRMLSIKLSLKDVNIVSSILDENNIEYDGIYEEA
ncbi:acetoin utilization protein AcuB [Marinitoga hydrogenitolerans DSM 16785]|uniref:Acetoin utilization protein AcuB n=1 Tax=Marinitoga hydrogenitolerans (strain DSM 16785 / JCM 12826 / AT1271) TaxID=1122195 RepID=A0A1M4UHM4_MARH1|nr:CBS domain-containing protein [Marinitoga hydrogenitolerans]SHE56209.1 acetoin utilization protein AcuB [Marinitoga hydrogenitolerans DSM 16785]